jgi:hypothetical protein
VKTAHCSVGRFSHDDNRKSFYKNVSAAVCVQLIKYFYGDFFKSVIDLDRRESLPFLFRKWRKLKDIQFYAI